ncbi:hypothetical protein NBE98_21035 [Clostridium swellfunianum]|uniref:hypothetical protein n=1 Tax=Clostridium swellfunianum TaxID=1367462 RepID=UPI002030F9CE|nr:hypothetical protein [Clostridium swellfunianum]MCM0650844.1 hypothetical protein [Clostridium swellfunianum]
MSKKILRSLAISLTTLLLLLTGCSDKPIVVETQAKYKSYDYNELKNYAHTIALITTTDKLTPKNSYIKYNLDNTISDYYSLRNIKVDKFFKNENTLPEELQIAERCVLTKNNELIHPKDYENMKKGNKYIVFLCDMNNQNYPIIVSLNNGKIDLENFKLNKRSDVAIKSLIEFELDNVSNDFKESILKSSLSTSQVNYKEIQNVQVIKSLYGDLEVLFHYSEARNTTYIWINGTQFDTPGNITSKLSN